MEKKKSISEIGQSFSPIDELGKKIEIFENDVLLFDEYQPKYLIDVQQYQKKIIKEKKSSKKLNEIELLVEKYYRLYQKAKNYYLKSKKSNSWTQKVTSENCDLYATYFIAEYIDYHLEYYKTFKTECSLVPYELNIIELINRCISPYVYNELIAALENKGKKVRRTEVKINNDKLDETTPDVNKVNERFAKIFSFNKLNDLRTELNNYNNHVMRTGKKMRSDRKEIYIPEARKILKENPKMSRIDACEIVVKKFNIKDKQGDPAENLEQALYRDDAKNWVKGNKVQKEKPAK